MSNNQELLDKVITAHGGVERWGSISEITARFRTGGLLFFSKFVSSKVKRIEITVSTNRPYAVVSPFPTIGYKGILDKDMVYIESGDGKKVQERANSKSFFKSFRHNLWWDSLDTLYFVGYASWNYLCTPFMFLLPGFEIEEIDSWYESGEKWNRLKVIFPADFPTHCREQIFYFNSDGFLKRHDYTAEVVGNWAKAAHYCFEHKNFSGLIVPTKRRVFPRRQNNNSFPIANIVSIDIEDIFIS